MKHLSTSRICWWLGFLASATFPLWFLGIILNFGGYVIDEISFGFFRFLVWLSFFTAFALTLLFLLIPKLFLLLRVLFGVPLSLCLFLGSCSPMLTSNCEPETMVLGKFKFSEYKSYASKSGCESQALTFRSRPLRPMASTRRPENGAPLT